jgi:plasmid stabilization system protein ParE
VYDLLITAAAEADLDSIVEYIALTLNNPVAAKSLLDRIEESYRLLRSTPLAYAECSDSVFRAKRYRKVVINNYLLVYRIDEKLQTVYVLRFFYGRQDYAQQL